MAKISCCPNNIGAIASCYFLTSLSSLILRKTIMTNTPTKTIHTIDALTLEKLLRKGDVTLIDVRELDEYRSVKN
jgi:hypothetical protein